MPPLVRWGSIFSNSLIVSNMLRTIGQEDGDCTIVSVDSGDGVRGHETAQKGLSSASWQQNGDFGRYLGHETDDSSPRAVSWQRNDGFERYLGHETDDRNPGTALWQHLDTRPAGQQDVRQEACFPYKMKFWSRFVRQMACLPYKRWFWKIQNVRQKSVVLYIPKKRMAGGHPR